MRISIRVRLFAAIALPALAYGYTFELKPENTKIEETLSDPLHAVHGAFNLTRGELTFDPTTGKASGEVIVDVTSGASGSGARDHKMHSTVLESAKYPVTQIGEQALAIPTPTHSPPRQSPTVGTPSA